MSSNPVDHTGTTAAGAERTPRLLVPTLVLLTTVTGVVSSLGAPLVPTIARDLDVSLSTAQWTLTAALLTGAVATPVMGRYAAAHRRRPVVVGGMAIVVLGTVLAAVGAAIDTLSVALIIAGRVCQGVGMALTPLAMAVARDVLPAHRIGSVIAVLSVGTVAGAGLGYPLTAAVAQLGGLAAAFWFGAALSGLTLALAWWQVPAAPRAVTPRVRPSEALLLGGATLTLLLGLSQSTSWGWADVRTLVLLVVGALGVVGWVRLTLRRDAPLVDLRLAFRGAAAGPNVTGLLAGAGMYMGLTLLMILVQTETADGWGLGQPVLVAGLMLVPYSIMSVVGSRISLWLGRYVDHVRVLPMGCAVYLASALLLAFAHDHVWQALLAMALAGLGSGGTFATLPVLLVRAVPPTETGSALAFNLVLRYVGFAAGSAAGVTALGLASGGPVPDEHGFVVASLVNAGVWVVAIGVVLWFSRPATRVAG